MVHRHERLTDRAEFELGWLAFGLLLGVGYLLSGPSPAIAAVLPTWFAYLWAAAFLLGAVAGFTAMRATFSLSWHRYYWGLAGERAGHTLHAGAVSTLGVAVVYAWLRFDPQGPARHGPFPVLGVALAVVWMSVTLRRIVRITQIIKAMAALADQGHPAGEGGSDEGQ